MFKSASVCWSKCLTVKGICDRYKGKSYSAKVEICRTGDQVEEFCRKICVKLECCPNLVSPRCLTAGVACPDNCGHLSKTKFSTCNGFFRLAVCMLNRYGQVGTHQDLLRRGKEANCLHLEPGEKFPPIVRARNFFG